MPYYPMAARDQRVLHARKQERVFPRLAFPYRKCKAPKPLPAISRRLNVNPRTFAPTAQRGISFPVANGARIPGATHCTRLLFGAVSLAGTPCIATCVCTNTPTRDGHAPKRSLITSILLPLTAHYRASAIRFF